MRSWLVLLAACGAAQQPRVRDGAIAGLARDHDSGDAIAKAEIRVRAQGELEALVTISDRAGIYGVDHLAPGKYSLVALFAGQPVDIENIDVRAGETSVVDVVFTLGKPDPVTVDFGNPKDGAIDRYRPPSLTRDFAVIEGTVNDASTHERVGGAVVTAYRDCAPANTDGSASRERMANCSASQGETLQTVSDEQGRYRFDRISPGTYAVSAYYSIGGRGQIEVRRGDIRVDGAEAVIVPLWVELAKQ